MRQYQRQRLTPKPGAFTWLGALAVVLLQLQLATHLNLDHDTLVEADESCEVCLKLDASGKVPTAAQAPIPVPREQATEAVAYRVPALPTPTRTRSARAPPQA